MTKQLLLLTLLLSACAGSTNRHDISLKIEGAGGRTVFFDKFENNAPVHLDSVVLDAQGGGVLSIPALPLDFYRIALDDEDALVIALDSTEDLSVRAKVGGLRAPDEVTGSAHARAIVDFVNRSEALGTELQQLKSRLNAGDQDSATLDRFNTLNADYLELVEGVIAGNPGSPVQYLAVNRLNFQENLDKYVQVRNDLRTPMASSAIYIAFRDNVDRAEMQMKQMQEMEERQRQVDNLIPVGGEAPDFSQATPDGGSLSLSSFRGKVVLIDFWASWCRPCRMENPNVKRVYDKYHPKGFEILGVSLDRSHDAWVMAIQQDGLPWKHVSDLGFWNNAVAQQYGVTSIPFTVLVDREGKILAKGLRGPELERKLAEVLGG